MQAIIIVCVILSQEISLKCFKINQNTLINERYSSNKSRLKNKWIKIIFLQSKVSKNLVTVPHRTIITILKISRKIIQRNACNRNPVRYLYGSTNLSNTLVLYYYSRVLRSTSTTGTGTVVIIFCRSISWKICTYLLYRTYLRTYILK